jgi:hypothetical protein
VLPPYARHLIGQEGGTLRCVELQRSLTLRRAEQ